MTDSNNEESNSNNVEILLNAIEDTDYFFCEDEWGDCNLSGEDFRDLLGSVPSSVDEWSDVNSKEHPSLFSFDDAKKKNWEMGKKEIEHIKGKISSLFNSDTSNLSAKEIHHQIALELLGPESKTGQFLCRELGMSREKYLSFMCTCTIQAAYRVSVVQLYDTMSLLKKSVPMSEENYCEIWLNMATKKEVQENMI